MTYKSSRVGTVILLAAIVAALAIAVMMFGAHFNLWEPIVGFGLVRTYMNPVAYGVLGLGVVGLLLQLFSRNRAGAVKTVLASLIGVGLLAPTIYSQMQPQVKFPPIHDISTDTVNPPQFLVLDETRAGAKNSLVYGGAETAAHQQKAYPDIAPIQTHRLASLAYAEALRVGQAMGWEIVAQDPAQFRFEATARTPVYQFADDIVVVVTPLDSASQIDIRSVSRVGRSDRGVNAARIREFIQAFN